MTSDPTLREALALHYRANGLPPDGGRLGATWTIRFGGRALRLSNFGWRREALPLHDAHHLLTGYPCTLAGELEMAAWEFSAGRFRHIGATLFCLPLIGAGFLVLPQRAYAAFVRGRLSRSLYAAGAPAAIMETRIAVLRAMLSASSMSASPVSASTIPTSTASASRLRDRAVYAGWVAMSLAWMAVPAGLAAVWVRICLF